MNELDQIWSQMLDDAATKALDSGQSEIAEYLRLKAANDMIRSEGVKWLFDALIEIAGEAIRNNAGLTIERVHPHRFARGNSNMVGSLVSVRQGVRCLTLEAGWTRTPSDGIMRRGALAAARITHFGIRGANADLVLAYAGSLPLWQLESEDGERSLFKLTDLDAHFRTLIGQ